MNYSPALEIGNSRDFEEIREQVHRIVHLIAPAHDLTYIDHAFSLAEASSRGMLLGYSGLRTPYHDQGHMLEVVLCSVRLLHGLHLAGQVIAGVTIDACIIGALLHDSGYLMYTEETSGTGAQFTLMHVARGVVFAEKNLDGLLPRELLSATGKVILTTDHRPVAVMPTYDNPAEQVAAWVTATADLVAQMANREYLERLLLLYFEFREAGITYFSDVHDLFEKTDAFYRLMQGRLQGELGNLTPYLLQHFDQVRGMKHNYYAESLGRNMDYLSNLIREERARRFDLLRRGGIIETAVPFLDHDHPRRR